MNGDIVARLREAVTVLDESYHRSEIEAVLLEAADAIEEAKAKEEPAGCPTPGACSGLTEIKRINAAALSDIAQIYGLLQEGRADEAIDYCQRAAEYYAPD